MLMLNMSSLKNTFISVALIIFSVLFIRSTFVMLQSKKRIENLDNEVAYLEEQRLKIENSIAYKNSPDYIEEIARNELNLVKPQEEIYIVQGLENDIHGNVLGDFSDSVVKTPSYTDSIWYMWYRLFAN